MKANDNGMRNSSSKLIDMITKKELIININMLLGRTLYDNYLSLVALKKQQIKRTKIQRIAQEHWITEKLYKKVRIPMSTK